MQQATHPPTIAAPQRSRSTAPVVGLLQQAAQLGCLPGLETAQVSSSLVGSLAGSTRWYSEGAANCPCVWVAVSLSCFARTPQNAAAKNTGIKNHRTRHPGKSRTDKGPKPTDQGIHASARDFSTLIRDKCHPNQVVIGRMKNAARGSPGLWQVWSGRVRRISKSRGSGRAGPTRIENLAGRVDSGLEVFKSRGSGRVGSTCIEILAFGAG